jgi:hypothetical protein
VATIIRGVAKLPTGSTTNILTANVKNDGKVVYDGAIAAAGTALTSATAGFTSADVGKAFRIDGAGTGGTGAYGTITAFVSATQVTITALNTVATTVSARRLEWGTDNTAAIQAAWDLGGQWFWPDGLYCCVGRTATSGVPCCLFLGAKDYVENTGAGNATISMLRDDSSLIHISGVEKLINGSTVTRANMDSSTNRFAAQPTYLMSAVAKRAQSITATTAGDATSLKPGDLILLRAGQCITSPAINAEPDSEYHRVKSVSGATINLSWPTGKTFAQEYQHGFNQVSRTVTKPSVRTAISSGVTSIPVDSRVGLRNTQVIGIGQGGTWESRTISVEPALGDTSVTVSVATTNAHAAGEPISMTWLSGAHSAGATSVTLNSAHADLKAGYKLHLGWGATQETVTVTGAPTGNVVPVTALANSYADHDPVSIGTLLGFQKIEPYTVKGLAFDGLGFYMPDTTTNRTCIVVRGGVSDWTIRNCRADLSHHFTDGIEWHYGRFHHNRLHFRAPIGATTFAWPFLGATGCTDADIHDNLITAEGRLTGWHLHEGCARFRIHDNTIIQPDHGTSLMPIYEINGRCHDILAHSNNYMGGNLYAIIDEASAGSTGQIYGDTFDTASVGTSGGWGSLVYTPGIWIDDPYGTNLSVGYGNPVMSNRVPQESRTLWAEVTPSSPTSILGSLPKYSYVEDVWIDVDEAFNAGTTNSIVIGYSGDNDFIALTPTITTTGKKTGLTAGVMGRLTNVPVADITAYYTQTGTTATTGRAYVFVKYVVVSQR